MKRVFSYLLVAMLCIIATSLFTSCAKDEENLIGGDEMDQYAKDIVGKWQKAGELEYWRFDAQGAGSVGYGEEWDEADDIYEGEDGTMKFKWHFDKTGLIIEYKTSGSYFPLPESPFTILSLTATSLRWETSDHSMETFNRVK